MRDNLQEFWDLVLQGMQDCDDARLVLSKLAPGADPQLLRWTVRPVKIKAVRQWLKTVHLKTRELSEHQAPQRGMADLQSALGHLFLQANFRSAQGAWQCRISRKGQVTVTREASSSPPNGSADRPGDSGEALQHDRSKKRWVDQGAGFLNALGVTDEDQRVVPAMARKWKQINRFIEVLDPALRKAGLAPGQTVKVSDFGSGKGYLTFALHAHLQHCGWTPSVKGVELRPDMVQLCNGIVQNLAVQGLEFSQGDVASHSPQPVDVMVALHACDTATDHAIAYGIRAGASVIVCSPCCHKELRPQMLAPHPLRPLLQHGIHMGQEAEMLTDGLRALHLSARGYETQVFEFVSLEHTAKNKMILAVRRAGHVPDQPSPEIMAQIAQLKDFYGVKHQALSFLLGDMDFKSREAPQALA